MNNLKITPIVNYSQNYNIKKTVSNPQKTISGNSSLPIMSGIYYNPSFGLNNPQAALYRAKNIQKLYAKKDVPYLLPDKVWDNKKIFEHLAKAGKCFDTLKDQKNLCAQTLTAALSLILPKEIAQRIRIKEMQELEDDLRAEGCTKEEIREYMNCEAITDSAFGGDSTIYLNFKDGKKSRTNSLYLKSAFKHELKHALTAQCTNIAASDVYNDKIKNNIQGSYQNNAFFEFENRFGVAESLANSKINKKNMFENIQDFTTGEYLHCKDSKELYKHFDKASDEIVKDTKEKIATDIICQNLYRNWLADGRLLQKLQRDGKLVEGAEEKIIMHNPKRANMIRNVFAEGRRRAETFDNQDFWRRMQHSAKDEKEAYVTNDVYREINRNNKPVISELTPLVYAEMEKYFKSRAEEAKQAEEAN